MYRRIQKFLQKKERGGYEEEKYRNVSLCSEFHVAPLVDGIDVLYSSIEAIQ